MKNSIPVLHCFDSICLTEVNDPVSKRGSSGILRDNLSYSLSRQSLLSEALGSRHAARRCGIQCMQLAPFCTYSVFSGCRIGVRHDGYRAPHLNINEKQVIIQYHLAKCLISHKSGKLQCKRPPFSVQNMAFYKPKDGLLQGRL